MPAAAKPRKLPKVSLFTYPKFFFVWPIIFSPLALMVLESAGMTPQQLGWIYAGIVALVALTLGIDLDRNTSFFWGLFLLTIVLSIKVIAFEWGWSLSEWALQSLQQLNVSYNPGLAWAISVLVGIPYIAMLVWTRIQDRWKITPYEFEHFSFGVVDQSLARGAKMVRTSYPDFLEVLFGLSGTLHVYSSNGDKELVKIQHIPFLPFAKARIARVLDFARMKQETFAVGEDEAASS